MRRLLADPTAKLVTWRATPISYLSWSRSSGGLLLIGGTAVTGSGGEQPWQIIVKDVRYRPWTPDASQMVRQCDHGGDRPDDWGYWRREPQAVSAGLLASLPGVFRGPPWLGVERLDATRYRMWQGFVAGLPGESWAAGTLTAAAANLAVMHAQFLARPPAPRPWYCRSFVEQPALRARASYIDAVREAASDPRVRRLVPRALHRGLRRLWATHPLAVGWLRSVPQTLCHRDLHPGNLRQTSAGATVALDWAQVGVGPPGEDLATMLYCWALTAAVSPAEAVGAMAAAERRYYDGLPAVAGVARTAFRLTAAYHYGLPLGVQLGELLSLPAQRRAERVAGPRWRARLELAVQSVEAVQADLDLLTRGAALAGPTGAELSAP
ncbi:aminoglycoside phosphotransferase family protein [Pilimelia terevasa]|uniref:aminoglycoside phosphotransferase family protein n=1 Tax=Pilimelia terevasa TaxID=53372 RepID=UPI00166E5A33|nr:aminoglycoside phosphotransferase family protein [Pilimelia terevasa]